MNLDDDQTSASLSSTSTVLLYGIGISGIAVGDAFHRRGIHVVAVDDSDDQQLRPDERTARQAAVLRWGTSLIVAPDQQCIERLVQAADLVCPAPGIPEHHPVITAALLAHRPIRSEIDLAYEWEEQRSGGPRPMLAITGTDGKTTTTMMATAMLTEAGLQAVAVGNTEVPLVAEIDGDADVFVVECSSFRLNWTEQFRAVASVWLNLAPDHLNWHRSLEHYEASKARLWRHCRPTDVAVGNADDPTVMHYLRPVHAIQRTFGSVGGDYCVTQSPTAGPMLTGPMGAIVPVNEMSRSLPHDITNALAAASIGLESGLATVYQVAAALRTFQHPPHRIEPVGTRNQVAWFNDSKATSPHAALTAIRSFDRIVLLVGGQSKNLDLSELATEHARIVAVVGLGETGPTLAAMFDQYCPTTVVSDMAQAVEAADRIARPGDTVLLSPACTSFDWYGSAGYPARGNEFKSLVRQLIGSTSDAEDGA